MNRATLYCLRGILLIFLFGNSAFPAPVQEKAPFGDWLTAAPESPGMVATRLEALWGDLEGRRTTALLVIRNDAIVFERYAAGWTRTGDPDGRAICGNGAAF